MGTRHRAALGISEVTDSVTITVSEETGGISVTKNGELHRDLDKETLANLLQNELMHKFKPSSSRTWNWMVKRNE
ncbi:hypothetical protein J416_02444 [Gracilibacillus halophilus YIM-C55.5]|uniref:DAC domain-containing protein n=1 Tax=Gracilibacillus halophilus YIM-C55.5 TaxID=1308866 RepID=N4WYG5_9BACI|nr:hypothetical protein J416_02444 [Gracilibacillus halophilus YIM-C55.5]